MIERAFVSDELVAAAWEAAGAIAPDALRIEADASSPSEALVQLVRAFGEAGLLGLVAPTAEHGVPRR